MIFQLSDKLIAKAIQVAAQWQRRANGLRTVEEKRRQDQLARLLAHPTDKVILTKLLDISFRSANPARVADQVHYLLKTHGRPAFFSLWEKGLLLIFQTIGRYWPKLTIPKMVGKMRADSGRLIIPGESEVLHAHLETRRQQNVQVNLNHLGEAVLGEAEAQRRLNAYLQDLQNPLIEYISVKISTIYSQILPLAFDHCVDILVQRLSTLFAAAQQNTFERGDKVRVPKFVNLDMEAFSDVAITVAAFQKTLDQKDFKNYTAGIVLQAYLPEAYAIQQRLTAWSRARVADGGAPIKIRVVKGANLEMEHVEAALRGWPLATYDNKIDVDANFKRMLIFGLQPENIGAVHIGVASHNLFELAFAHEVAKANQVEDKVVFEMLEGMADHVRRAITDTGHPVLLYAPVAAQKEFLNAIAYLVRRMDENTGSDNYLRHVPHLEVDSTAWQKLQADFVTSCERIDLLGDGSHRNQNRLTGEGADSRGTLQTGVFVNEADTDWSLEPNRQWAQQIRRRWKKKRGDAPIDIPLVVDGTERYSKEMGEIVDPNQLPRNVCVARHAWADGETIAEAVAVARRDPDNWRGLALAERHTVLSRVARGLRRARGDLIGAAAADTGKLFVEADIEVSEAVDFCEYYPYSAGTFEQHTQLTMRGKGVGVVASPWNFPIAIPCGGISAALAAGNTVIFKPSSDAVLAAWQLCRVFWEAGVSKKTLQFVPCRGAEAGMQLIAHPGVDFVILTGGTATGLQMLGRRPDLFLAAETGGKNATIVTAMADRGQAVHDVIQSAFGHGGQKCSATSLLILEKEVYDDPLFKRQLVDAARSWSVGSAWDFQNRMGPLIRPPEGDLRRGLTRLEPGESWALEPTQVKDNPRLWTPGIKWGVSPGSFMHMTELFGPVLAVMCADHLDAAVALANQTGYGLTAGLQSLDPREIEQWQRTICAGNLYINRGTTGAITLRQPFGGMGKSAIGPAIKTGGPNYVTQFMIFEEDGLPEVESIETRKPLGRLAEQWQHACRSESFDAHTVKEIQKSVAAVKSYLYWHEKEFGCGHDYFHLRGQDNIHRYLPAGHILIALHEDDALFETLARVAAAHIAGCRVTLSVPSGLDNGVTRFLESPLGRPLMHGHKMVRQTDAGLINMLSGVDRMRLASAQRASEAVMAAAAKHGIYIARSTVMMDGRLELLHYVIGQSLCNDYHRYGNLGERSGEFKTL